MARVPLPACRFAIDHSRYTCSTVFANERKWEQTKFSDQLAGVDPETSGRFSLTARQGTAQCASGTLGLRADFAGRGLGSGFSAC